MLPCKTATRLIDYISLWVNKKCALVVVFVLGLDLLSAGDVALVPRAARPSEPVAGTAHEDQVLVVLITVGLEGREFGVIYKKICVYISSGIPRGKMWW